MTNLHPIFEEIMKPFLAPPGESIEMQAYRKGLKNHDRFYGYSDDGDVWRRGNIQRKQPYNMQRVFDPQCIVWNEYAPDQFKQAATVTKTTKE